MIQMIGREEERNELLRCIKSKKAEFVAVYGRRRVGKTYLITQTLKDKVSFEMTGGIDGNAKEQFFYFTDALRRAGCQDIPMPKNWHEAFAILRDFLDKKPASAPQVIFIDELPSLDTPRSDLVTALDHFWNTWASRRPGVKLVVCGSATSWMVTNLIDSKGGLHNRITREIHLRPFTLHETERYFKSLGFKWNRQMMAQAYMALGGIPYYLGLLDATKSFAQNIDALYFGGGELSREYPRLYKSLFRQADIYMQIISLLAASKQGMTREEISRKLKIKTGGTLTDALRDLVNCDFLRCRNIRLKTRVSASGVYQLVDFFSLFHLTFGTKAISEPNFWSRNLNTPTVNVWQGLAFERLCMAHIEQIRKALGLDKIYVEGYAWRSFSQKEKAQIDLILDRADGIINVCEIKYSDDYYVMSKAERDKILRRNSLFREETSCRKALLPVLVTTNGLREGQNTDIVTQTVTLNELFV
ncbi:MAG: AAA family ATPase [Bacteroides sp.]|nr:AAA family ATPase [Ruminococcus flavefaciens]MCM1555054.1 AAA family ATPase [Bacteroides sp.]MCM1555495.1 AAA family ATPase [Bacteroides sp.]